MCSASPSLCVCVCEYSIIYVVGDGGRQSNKNYRLHKEKLAFYHLLVFPQLSAVQEWRMTREEVEIKACVKATMKMRKTRKKRKQRTKTRKGLRTWN